MNIYKSGEQQLLARKLLEANNIEIDGLQSEVETAIKLGLLVVGEPPILDE